MPTALLLGYPTHVKSLARFVNQHGKRWRILPYGVDRSSRNRALVDLPFSDAVIGFGGPKPDALIAACARRLRKPVAVIWAGTDVMDIRNDPEKLARARASTGRHVACSAGLAAELSELGIAATALQLVVAETRSEPPPLPATFSVLGYAPSAKAHLYGADIILETARRLPNVRFEIIGDMLADRCEQIDNVTFRGWLDNVEPAIDAATVIIRPTRHDGMPLMVVEALARGRYVIWSQHIAGGFCASTAEGVVAHLTQLETAHLAGTLTLNHEGMRTVATAFSPADVTARFEAFLDELLASSKAIYPHAEGGARRRAVVSGTTEQVMEFVQRMRAAQWDVHPLVGSSKSERLDNALSIAACDTWISLDENRIDPVIKTVASMLRKRPMAAERAADALVSSRIRGLRAIPFTTSEWCAFDACNPAPSFFARPAWGLALERALGTSAAAPMLFSLGEGEALFPLMRSGKQFSEIKAMPLGTYSMPLRLDGKPADTQTAAAIVRWIARHADDFTCTLWPLAGLGPIEGFEETRHEAAIIDLRSGADAAIARFKGVARRMAGQAVRKGVTCAREPGAVDVYYKLLEDSARRWGLERPHVPKSLFEAVEALGGNDVEIWIARYAGEAIAGGVILYGSSEAFFWSAALRAEYADLRPSNLLNAELIRAACERGMQWYNLGASEGLPGVERFKESLGAEFVAYSSLAWRSQLYARYLKVRAALSGLSRLKARSAS